MASFFALVMSAITYTSVKRRRGDNAVIAPFVPQKRHTCQVIQLISAKPPTSRIGVANGNISVGGIWLQVPAKGRELTWAWPSYNSLLFAEILTDSLNSPKRCFWRFLRTTISVPVYLFPWIREKYYLREGKLSGSLNYACHKPQFCCQHLLLGDSDVRAQVYVGRCQHLLLVCCWSLS